jgi:predicted acyl esterase
MGINGVTLPPDPIQMQPTYEGAREAFEAQPPVRILFDNGAGGNQPGEPVPGFEHSFASFPAPGTEGRSFYFGDGGRLTEAKPATAGADGFVWNAKARPLTNFTGNTAAGEGGLWTATPPYEWSQHPAGSAASYLSEPLSEDTVVLGAGAVEAWIRSSAPNVDLQATVSEVRPDGKEVFVQGGWLRGSMRKLDRRKSRPLEPVLSLRRKDMSPLPDDRFVKATIPLYYQGHAYRAGSRIRVTISAPNGDQPIWSFEEAQPDGTAEVAIARSARQPSRLHLPVVAGVDVPTGLPPCPGTRGQPCRDFQAYANTAAGW